MKCTVLTGETATEPDPKKLEELGTGVSAKNRIKYFIVRHLVKYEIWTNLLKYSIYGN
jgi:hypothetical protein